MSELEILFSPTATGRWRALVLKCPPGVFVEGFNPLGAAFDLDRPDFSQFEAVNPRVGYHRRDLPDGGIRVTFPANAVRVAVDWLRRAATDRFDSTA